MCRTKLIFASLLSISLEANKCKHHEAAIREDSKHRHFPNDKTVFLHRLQHFLRAWLQNLPWQIDRTREREREGKRIQKRMKHIKQKQTGREREMHICKWRKRQRERERERDRERKRDRERQRERERERKREKERERETERAKEKQQPKRQRQRAAIEGRERLGVAHCQSAVRVLTLSNPAPQAEIPKPYLHASSAKPAT